MKQGFTFLIPCHFFYPFQKSAHSTALAAQKLLVRLACKLQALCAPAGAFSVVGGDTLIRVGLVLMRHVPDADEVGPGI